MLRAMLTVGLAVGVAAGGPPGGQLVAGVDVGSKGTKLVVLRVGADGTAERVLAKTLDPTPLADRTPDGSLSAGGIERTAKAVDALVQLAVGEKVPADAVQVVGSSGLGAAPNRNDLAAAVKTRTGRPMEFLTPTDEAILQFRGLVPSGERDHAMVIDVGSGNTRVVGSGLGGGERWYVNGTADVGSVSLSAKADTTADAARHIGTRFTDLADGHPTLTHHRRVCYLSGGAAWAAVTFTKPAQANQAVVTLTAADLEAFAKLVDKTDGPPALDAAGVSDQAVRKQAEAEARRVLDSFTPNDLRAGAAILKAVTAAYQLNGKELRFRRDGQFAWVLARLTPEPPPPAAPLGVRPPCPPPLTR